MISDLDIWRSAQVLISRYGDGAGAEAHRQADCFPADTAPRRFWLDVLEKVQGLQRVAPGSGEPVH